MSRRLNVALEKTALTFLSAVLFVGFFQFNGFAFSAFEHSQGVNWVFLPAGFRVILVLVLGLPGAIGLMLGSWFIDRDLLTGPSYALAVANGLVADLTPWLVMKYLHKRQWLSQQLHTITPPQLFQMILIFAASSAVMHQLVWLLLERPGLNIWVDVWPMFVGNATGTLLMLYVMKFVLDWAQSKRSRQES